MIKKYEVIVVLDPDLDDAAVQVQVGKVKDLVAAHGGAVDHEEVIGRQPLSYPIGKKTFGTYVLLVVSTKGTFVAEFNRNARISDEIIRSIVVKKDKFAPDFIRRKDTREDRRPPGGFFGGDDGDSREDLGVF